MKRVEKFSKKFVKFAARTQEILALEGWYEFHTPNDLFEQLEIEYKNSGTRQKMSRWLIRNKGMTSDAVSVLINQRLNGLRRFKLSARYNDLFRIADTRSYRACTRPGGAGWKGPINLVTDPTYCVIYIPDKSGKFLGRVVATIKGKKCTLYRGYGQIDLNVVALALQKEKGLDVEVLGYDFKYLT